MRFRFPVIIAREVRACLDSILEAPDFRRAMRKVDEEVDGKTTYFVDCVTCAAEKFPPARNAGPVCAS